MERKLVVWNSFAESEEADRRYHRSLSPQERLDILLEIVARAHPNATDVPIERVYRIVDRDD